MLCPRCGEEKEEFVGNICVDCFIDREELFRVNEPLSMTVCVSCGAVNVGAWRDIGLYHGLDNLLNENVTMKSELKNPVTSIEVEEELPDRILGTLTVSGNLGGRHVVLNEPVEVRMERGICNRCSRASGGYYEAILQLRASDRELTEQEMERALNVAADLMSDVKGGEKSFVSRIEEVSGGVDLYFGNSATTKQLASKLKAQFGGTMSESASLAGRQDGQEIYRVTYLVRLPPFRHRDVLRYADSLYLVHSLGSVVELRELRTGMRKRVPVKKIQEDGFEREARQEDVERALVTMVQGDEIQLLDPDTMRAVALLRPEFIDESDQGSEVEVLRHDGELIPIHPSVLGKR